MYLCFHFDPIKNIFNNTTMGYLDKTITLHHPLGTTFYTPEFHSQSANEWFLYWQPQSIYGLFGGITSAVEGGRRSPFSTIWGGAKPPPPLLLLINDRIFKADSSPVVSTWEFEIILQINRKIISTKLKMILQTSREIFPTSREISLPTSLDYRF